MKRGHTGVPENTPVQVCRTSGEEAEEILAVEEDLSEEDVQAPL